MSKPIWNTTPTTLLTVSTPIAIFICPARAIDWFDVAAHGGSVEAGLAKIKTASNLVIGVRTDALFPAWQQKEIADALGHNGLRTTFVELPSIQGHDAFLIDEARFAPIVEEFFLES